MEKLAPGVILVLVAFLVSTGVGGKTVNFVTCGSAFKLINNAYKVRLHSHDIKYGSGSGQQSVTGSEVKEDVNSLWLIKGVGKSPCKRGDPIKCGMTVQLQHLQTNRNLHSHLFSSPLSGHQEISAFGEDGIGDTGDNWQVVCRGDDWQRDEQVQFRHADTDVFLSASGNTFGRPIHGQMEIVGVSSGDSASYWQTVEGIFIHPSEAISRTHHEHNEL